jgi:hypothetical protein
MPKSSISEFSITDEKIKYISKQFNIKESYVKSVYDFFLRAASGVKE